MKKILQTLTLAFAPFVSFSQLTLHNIENFQVGQKNVYLPCDYDQVQAGPGGNQTWNFSTITMVSDTMHEEIKTNPSGIGNPFASASFIIAYDFRRSSFVKILPDGGVALIGEIDSANSFTNHYPNIMTYAKTQFAYGDSFTDTFRETYLSGAYTMSGTGITQVTADGYGTLILPNGTFSNVLRIKMVQHLEDSANTGDVSVTDNTTYFWYDDAHPAALLKMDSIHIGGLTQPFTIKGLRYLLNANATGIEGTTRAASLFSAHLEGQYLTLSGDFDRRSFYDLELTDAAGRMIYRNRMAGSRAAERICLESEPAAGLYLLRITEDGVNAKTSTIKLIRQ